MANGVFSLCLCFIRSTAGMTCRPSCEMGPCCRWTHFGSFLLSGAGCGFFFKREVDIPVS